MDTYLNKKGPNQTRSRTARFTSKIVIVAGLLLGTTLLAVTRPVVKPVLASPDVEEASKNHKAINPAENSVAVRLVTLDGNDAGWSIIAGVSQWLAPECRTAIESGGGSFETVEWAVVENTLEPTYERACEEVAELYFSNDAPTQTETETATPSTPSSAGQTSVRLLTMDGNDDGWALIGGTSQWLASECRTGIENGGGSFEVVEWSVIESTYEDTFDRTCEEIADLYFNGDATQPATGSASAGQTSVRLLTLEGNDAGWSLIDGASQWLAPGCRTGIENDGGSFEIVEWSVIESTYEDTSDRTCDEIADLYFNGGSTQPATGSTPTIPSQTNVSFLTIEGVDAGWSIIDGYGQWLSPVCRRLIESNGGTFTIVDWAVIEQTAVPETERSCDEVVEIAAGIGTTTTPGSTPTTGTPGTNPPQPVSGDVRLSRGINLAGDFEVTPRGSWGTDIEDEFFPLVANAGFDHVRIPIAWSAYTGSAPEYRIDEGFFGEVDRLVELANNNRLGIVIDVHFFEELDENPWGERDRYMAIWDQIARRYQDQPGSVVFELLNEPIGVFNDQPDVWNQLAAEALAVVRQTNPNRTVIIGPVSYNHASRLSDLRLPNDPNIVATIHTYDPHEFTHQGAVFNDPVPPTGVLWRPTDSTIGLDWADQSWGVDVTSAGSNGIELNYSQQYGALGLVPDASGRQYRELVIETDRPFDAIVICNYQGTEKVDIDIDFVGSRGTADISSCGGISSIGIQLIGTDLGAVTVRRLSLCNGTCDEIIVTQFEALDGLITNAAGWAANQGVPLYIGEFGTLDPAGDPTDPQSRADWTRSVRTIAEQNGVGWAYFELSSDFGAYDNESGRWIPELLTALMG